VDVRTPALQSLGAVHSVPLTFTDSATPLTIRVAAPGQILASTCGGAPGGFVGGAVQVRGDSLPPRNARVTAEWTEIVVRNGMPARQSRWTDVRTDSTGAYRLCGVPINAPLTLHAQVDTARSDPVAARIDPMQRMTTVDLLVERAAARTALLVGVVVSDDDAQPLSDVEVTVASQSLRVYTNEAGGFRLSGIQPGTHEVTLRKVGYKLLALPLEFAASQTVERRFRFTKIPTLDPVAVSASAVLPTFEEHRRLGLGHFLTRADLERFGNLQTSGFLRQVSGVSFVAGKGQQAWILSKRAKPSGREVWGNVPENTYFPTDAEKRQGMVAACYARVYLDRMLLNPGTPTTPFNINEISAERMEAVEWYASEMQAPGMYQGKNADCGVLVIHTRRNYGK
jgi:hypothetical protein